MSGPLTGVGCRLSDDPARRGHKGIDDVLGEHDHLARMGTRMNNIFWIIGVIVVVIAVLGFFGLR
jgi:hypothetical protein